MRIRCVKRRLAIGYNIIDKRLKKIWLTAVFGPFALKFENFIQCWSENKNPFFVFYTDLALLFILVIDLLFAVKFLFLIPYINHNLLFFLPGVHCLFSGCLIAAHRL